MARPRPQVIRLTDAAADRIKYVMANATKTVVGVRVGVKNGGCAGMTYTMEYADAVAPADIVGVEPLVAGERLEPQHLAVEARRALEIIHVERRLEHAVELRHGYHMLSVARASSDILV